MKITRLLAVPLAVAACSHVPGPHRLTDPNITPGVWGILEVPTTPGPHAAVVLLPGSYGWRPDYARFARTFADSGFVALAIDYYAETGRGASPADESRNWPVWQATVRNAVTYLEAAPAVAGRPIGLVGYSRGAFLAISVADSAPPVGAVVDFYGAGSDDDPPSARIPQFPPLLILHGEADTEVPRGPCASALRSDARPWRGRRDASVPRRRTCVQRALGLHLFGRRCDGFLAPDDNFSQAAAEGLNERLRCFVGDRVRKRLQPAARGGILSVNITRPRLSGRRQRDKLLPRRCMRRSANYASAGSCCTHCVGASHTPSDRPSGGPDAVGRSWSGLRP